jgi:hypothetical protein
MLATSRDRLKTAFGAQCAFWACTARAWTRQHLVRAPDNSAFALSELPDTYTRPVSMQAATGGGLPPPVPPQLHHMPIAC